MDRELLCLWRDINKAIATDTPAWAAAQRLCQRYRYDLEERERVERYILKTDRAQAWAAVVRANKVLGDDESGCG